MVSVADGFGIDLSSAARPALTKANFKLVYDKSYPIGTQDLAPIINEVEGAQSRRLRRLQLSAGYAGADRAGAHRRLQSESVLHRRRHRLPALSRSKFGKNTEGVMGIGGWSGDSPAIKDYLARHKASAANGAEPDRWASPVDLCQPADAAAGDRTRRQDRPRRRHQGSADRHVRYRDRQGQAREQHADAHIWWVGQWQDGEFYGIAPAGNEGARTAIVPKPAWSGAVTSRADAAGPVMTNAISDRPDARRHVCAHRHGAHAPVRRRAHHEPRPTASS